MMRRWGLILIFLVVFAATFALAYTASRCTNVANPSRPTECR